MRVKNKPWSKDKIAEHPEVMIPNPGNYKGRWREVFRNDDPLHLEIGTGKGQFILGMAKRYPMVNFIGIEVEQSIIISALEKWLEEPQPNVLLLNENAQQITEFFAEHELDEMYLNFSDPWPKHRHEKRRLTHQSFLKSYKIILKSKGRLNLKTDNQGLFEYSLESFSKHGLQLEQISLNLHASDYTENVKTEYEEKFSKQGHRIYRCEAIFPQ